MEFKIGDTVQLKSGGPKMTISSIPTNSKLTGYGCKWFAGAKLESGHFEADMLILVTEEPKKK